MDFENRIIFKMEADLLYSLEENNLAPNEKLSETDYQFFLKNVVGKTIWNYCAWRYPENPVEQLQLAKTVIK